MAIKDPEVGVRAVLKDFDKYLKDLKDYQKKTADAQNSLSSGALAANKSVVSLSNSLMAGASKMAAYAAAIVGVGIALKEVIELGVHGSIVSGVEEAFGRIQNSANRSADELLSASHKAAAGLTSDFNIMRQANVLMAGSTQETVDKLSESFPRLLEISRLQARATGGEVDYYFNSLVQGIKRAEPRLIDNTGLIIKVGEATKAYAKELDITTQEMTAEDKTIAILNATLAAGNRALIAYGDLSAESSQKVQDLGKAFEDGTITIDQYNASLEQIIQTTNAFTTTTAYEELQRLKVSFEEIRNDIGQAVEPLAAGILRVFNSIIEPIKQIIDELAPAFAAVFQIIGGILGGIGQAIGAVLAPILDVVKNIGKGILKTIIWIAYAIGGILMWAANTIIFPVVTSILETLASWLVGESPPPAGPLKDIDKGAANIMEAWISGLTGVSLDPVDQVIQQVAGIMGDVAFWDRTTVEARLKQLDEALRPFDERLRLIKANFEALKEPIDAAFREIDRQMEVAVKAMLAGDTEAAALVRQLDAQRQALNDYNKEQQKTIDNAAIQLAYVKAQQALEREILLIQQSRLGPEEKEAKIKELKAKALKGEAAARTVSPVTGYPVKDEDFGFNADVQQFITEATGFMGVGGFFADQQSQFQANQGKVSSLWSSLSTGIESSPIVTGFNNIKNEIEKIWNNIFGEDGILRKGIGDAWASLVSQIENGPIGQAFGTLRRDIETIWNNLFAEGGTIRIALENAWTWLRNQIEYGPIGTAFTTLKTTIENLWNSLFGAGDAAGEGKGTIRKLFEDTQQFIKEDLENGPIGQAWTALWTFLYNSWETLFGANGTIRLAFETAINTVTTFLENSGIKAAFETVFGAIGTAIGAVIEIVQNLLNKLTELFGMVSQAGVDANIVIPEVTSNPLTQGQYITINRDTAEFVRGTYALPSAYQKRAAGGPSRGTFLVGENGPELISLPPGITGWVDSNSVSQNKMYSGIMDGMFNTRMPYPTMPSGDQSWSYDNSTNYGNFTFNNVKDSNAVARRFAMMRVMRS